MFSAAEVLGRFSCKSASGGPVSQRSTLGARVVRPMFPNLKPVLHEERLPRTRTGALLSSFRWPFASGASRLRVVCSAGWAPGVLRGSSALQGALCREVQKSEEGDGGRKHTPSNARPAKVGGRKLRAEKRRRNLLRVTLLSFHCHDFHLTSPSVTKLGQYLPQLGQCWPRVCPDVVKHGKTQANVYPTRATCSG